MQDALLYSVAMGSAALAAIACYPLVSPFWKRAATRVEGYQRVKVAKATKALDDIFVDVKPKWLKVAYGVGPIAAGLFIFLLFNNLLMAAAGTVLGIVVPDLWVRQTKAMRLRKFQGQLVDALFILSSSLRAGLSLTQSFEVLESEMVPPASQEFGLVVKAHRVGRTLEEALQSLNRRMPCEELHLITTALLVARETGGDVTSIITQLIETIREKRKLNDKVHTLTMQGRLQAYIMSLLPFLFAVFVRTFNPHYFDILLRDGTGISLLIAAVVLWVLGMFLLFKLSKVEV